MKRTASKATAKKAATKKTAAKKAAVKKSGAKKSLVRTAADYAGSWKIAADRGATVKARVAALGEVTRTMCDDDAAFHAVLDLLQDPDPATPIPVRLAALQALQAASFSVVGFGARRGDYLAALRVVATDADPELRQRVLGLLARESDAHAQQLLLDGLSNPRAALVPPEKALQLLSYDPHSEAYAVARKVVSKPPSAVARREALRLLAGDATSVPIFEKVMADKSETPEVRKLSALALNTLAPAALQANARRIVLDDDEDPDMRATCLTALTDVGDDATTAKDQALHRGVDAIRSNSKGALQKGAKRFLAKFGR